MPGNHRFRLDDDENGGPIHPTMEQPCPEETIGRGQLRTLHGPLKHAQLLTKREVLQVEAARDLKVAERVEANTWDALTTERRVWRETRNPPCCHAVLDLRYPQIVLGSRNWITPAAEMEAMFVAQPEWFLDAIHEKIQLLNGYQPTSNQTNGELAWRLRTDGGERRGALLPAQDVPLESRRRLSTGWQGLDLPIAAVAETEAGVQAVHEEVDAPDAARQADCHYLAFGGTRELASRVASNAAQRGDMLPANQIVPQGPGMKRDDRSSAGEAGAATGEAGAGHAQQ